MGYKIDRDYETQSNKLKITQLVIMQSFADEFNLPSKNPITLMLARYIIKKGEENKLIDKDKQLSYRSRVGKMIHVLRQSKPESLNKVWEVIRFSNSIIHPQYDDMLRVIKYCTITPNKGQILGQDGKDKKFLFKILGKADEIFSSYLNKRKSKTKGSIFLEGVLVLCISQGQKYCVLSVTKASLIAVVTVVQYMIFVINLLILFELKVKLPMIIKIDNKGCIDLINNQSISGRSRHIDVRKNYLRELKENRIIMPSLYPGEKNSSDLFMKNLGGPLFEKHLHEYVGK